MERYKLVTEDVLNCYILDTKNNKIVSLCSTKRPDLGVRGLQEMLRKANEAEEGQGCNKPNKEGQYG